jgi:hypothetical protein
VQAAENDIRTADERIIRAGVNAIAEHAQAAQASLEKQVRLLFAAKMRHIVTHASAAILNSHVVESITAQFRYGAAYDFNTPLDGSPHILAGVLSDFDQLCAAWRQSRVGQAGEPVESRAAPEETAA